MPLIAQDHVFFEKSIEHYFSITVLGKVLFLVENFIYKHQNMRDNISLRQEK